jgi:MarR family transcriptional regulator, transcriptional regulator for hemolysin
MVKRVPPHKRVAPGKRVPPHKAAPLEVTRAAEPFPVAESFPATERFPVVEPLGRQLVFTAKAMRSAFEDAIGNAGGSLGSWIVLSALSERGCCTQAALASHVHLEGATITHHVDRLEAAGLVQRRLDPADRRVRMLELTGAGIELHGRLLAAVIGLQATVMAGLTVADRVALARCLGVIEANLASLGTSSSGATPAA